MHPDNKQNPIQLGVAKEPSALREIFANEGVVGCLIYCQSPAKLYPPLPSPVIPQNGFQPLMLAYCYNLGS